MKHLAFALALVLSAAPAYAQLGGLTKGINKAKETKDKVDKVSDLVIGEREERQIGEHISAQLVDRFGVYQDAAVAKYVSLVGTVLAQASSRPALDWQFIVLDTDGVNAYAAPGGLIHITRGALGLIRSEAELAGVLGHEITHVTARHTIRAIQKAKGVELGAGEVGGSGLTSAGISLLGRVGYDVLFENKFDRDDEMEADKVGIQVAGKVGYSPRGMIGFLEKIAARNQESKEPNGLFASHPLIKDRLAAMEKVIRDSKLAATATVEARYTSTITFEAKPAGAIAMDISGVRGAVGDSAAPAEPAKEEKKEEKTSGRKPLLGGIKLTGSSQAQNTQTVASAGSRGGVPDRDAVGGTNRSRVNVTLTPAEIDAFKKGIA
ncbi:MAG TPA: M48 family metalloprotease [Vicinamibacterales bacterium]|nr:M48 family metalloprotease [Vicinamibacterales bacterium]